MGLQILLIQPKFNRYIPRDLNYIHGYCIISQKQFYFLFFWTIWISCLTYIDYFIYVDC